MALGQMDVNARDEFGMTAMHVAAKGDHFKSVSYLINEVSDLSLLDKSGRSAMDLARSDSTKRILADAIRRQRPSANADNSSRARAPLASKSSV